MEPPRKRINREKLEKIPEELRECKQWLNWRYHVNDRGEVTKPPIGSATDPNNYTDFNTALDNAELNKWGIGFAFTDKDGFVGFDIDKKHYDEVEGFSDEALEIVNALNSYSEHSPSGKGIHIIVKGGIPDAVKNSIHDVEIYYTGRYFTVTGEHIEGTPTVVNEAQAALDKEWSSDVAFKVKTAVKDLDPKVRLKILDKKTDLTSKTIEALSKIENPETQLEAIDFILTRRLDEKTALQVIDDIINGVQPIYEVQVTDEYKQTYQKFQKTYKNINAWGYNHYQIVKDHWDQIDPILTAIEQKIQEFRRYHRG